jgi:predicted nucleotidyltransferase
MIEKLIRKIAESLDQEQISYMIIGGQAVLLYGSPRLTRDIDITLGVDTDQFSVVEGISKKLGLQNLPENPGEFARETKVFPAQDPETKMRVDFIFSFTPFESQAISRAKAVLMNDYPVKFASCEDLILHKMFASRAIDVEDVKGILQKHKSSIDLGYIEKWLSEFSEIDEHSDILTKFKSLL